MAAAVLAKPKCAPDTFRVVFRGNEFTTGERTQDFSLLRAAELTLEHGFSQFAVLNESHARYTPQTGLLIKCVSAKPDGISVFDAAFLENSIKRKYGTK